MKIYLAALMMFSFSASASTQAIFSADGAKATVLIMSMASGDPDASGLYAALAVPEEVMNGKRTKRFNFDNAAGSRAFSVVCVMSEYVPTNGTCTLIIHAGNESTIDKGALVAQLKVSEATDLARLLPAFVLPAAGEIVFGTRDGHLQIQARRQGSNILALEVNYR